MQMFNVPQPWLAAAKTNPTAILGEFSPQTEVTFWLLPVTLCTRLHVVTFFFVSQLFFKETHTECIHGMEAVPSTDEKGKRERGKKKPATQESSWNSPQLPNMTEGSQKESGTEDKNIDSVQCCLPTDWKNPRCPVQRVLQPRETPCCHKLSLYTNLASGFTLHFRGLFPRGSSSCEVSVGVSWLVAVRPR